ncbi:MAG: hypothetical protein LW694_07815 [Chitinophagaceae bacterium]|jgi:hypothetical protein|nr:hypothetical protein [Chitinophagaceae bacterium]
MKVILSISLALTSVLAQAQPRVVEKAIIKMQTEVTFPENFGGGGPGGGDEGGGMRFGSGGMDASSTIYFRGDMSKVESVSDFGNNVVISDLKNKRTTTLIEAMGRKTGYYSTPAEEQQMRARMDSMRDARRDSMQQARRDTLQRMGFSFGAPAKPEIVYTDQSKKIAGMNCKKAIIKNTQRGQTTETEVWYSPDFKLAPGFSLGGGNAGAGGGRGGMMSMAGVNGLDQLEGFPMEYTITRGNGFKIHMNVTKVQLDANIDDKVFEIPKGFELKPVTEMQQMGGSRGGFRMGM